MEKSTVWGELSHKVSLPTILDFLKEPANGRKHTADQQDRPSYQEDANADEPPCYYNCDQRQQDQLRECRNHNAE